MARNPRRKFSSRLTRFSAPDMLLAVALLTACGALLAMVTPGGEGQEPGRWSEGARGPQGARGSVSSPRSERREVRSGQILQGAGRATDGDSIRLGSVNIRLAGIDAPELRQTCERAGQIWRCGEAARSSLARRLGRGDLTCRSLGPDRYGRTLAACSVKGEEINAALVREGMAVAYGSYQREEDEARAARRGVWAGGFMRPDKWRRLNPRPSRPAVRD